MRTYMGERGRFIGDSSCPGVGAQAAARIDKTAAELDRESVQKRWNGESKCNRPCMRSRNSDLDPVPIDVEEALMSPDVSKGDAAGQSDQAGSLALVLIRNWAGDGVGLGLAEGRFVDEVQDAMSHGQGFGFV